MYSRIPALAATLSTLKKSDSESIAEYFQRAQALNQDLEIVECGIPEVLLSAIVLNGLPAEYDVIKEVLRSENKTLTLSQAMKPMIGTEELIASRSRNSQEASSSTLPSRSGKKNKSKAFGNYCKKKGNTTKYAS